MITSANGLGLTKWVTTAFRTATRRTATNAPTDAGQDGAGCHSERDAERVKRDETTEDERLQQVRLDLLDRHHPDEHEQRNERPLVDQGGHDGHHV